MEGTTAKEELGFPWAQVPTVHHVHEWQQPVKIELERGQRGGYGWKIEVRGMNGILVRQVISSIDADLRKEYGPKTEIASGD